MENKQNAKKQRVSANKSKLRRAFESRGLYIALCTVAASAIVFTAVAKLARNSAVETSFDEAAWLEAVKQHENSNDGETDSQDTASASGALASVSDSDSISDNSDSAYEIIAKSGNSAEIPVSDVIDIDNPEYIDDVSSDGEIAVLASAQPVAQAAEKSISFVKPCVGRIITECSLDDLIYCAATDDWRTHNGIDYAAEEGENVYAAAAGKVSRVYTDDLLGVTVVIDHGDNLCTFYSSLADEDFIKVNTVVKQGDLIGNIGKSCSLEKSLEPHLHFEISKDGTPQNPKDFL